MKNLLTLTKLTKMRRDIIKFIRL